MSKTRLTGADAVKEVRDLHKKKRGKMLSDSDYRAMLRRLHQAHYLEHVQLPRGRVDPRDKRAISLSWGKHFAAIRVLSFEGTRRMKPGPQHRQALLAHGYAVDGRGRVLINSLGAGKVRLGKAPAGELAIVRTELRKNKPISNEKVAQIEGAIENRKHREKMEKRRINMAKMKAKGAAFKATGDFNRWREFLSQPTLGKKSRLVFNYRVNYQLLYPNGGAGTLEHIDEVVRKYKDKYHRTAVALSSGAGGIWNFHAITEEGLRKYMDEKGISPEDEYGEDDPRHWIKEALFEHLSIHEFVTVG